MKQLLMLCAFFIATIGIWAQSTVSIKGKVVDDSHLPLAGAIVLINRGNVNVTTNAFGNFSVDVPNNRSYSLEIHHMGYATFRIFVDNEHPMPKEIVLQPLVEMLQEVTITDNRALANQRQASQTVELANADYLRANLSGSLMTSLDRLPGVGSLTIGSGQAKPMIRGLGFNRVVVVEDGLKHEAQQWGAEHGLEVDRYGVEQAEIIKGPASVTIGPDAIAGAIVLSRDKLPAPHQTSGSIDLTTQSNNALYGISGAVQARGDNLFFKARLSATSYGDYRVPADNVNIYSYRVPLYNGLLRNTAGNEQSAMAMFGAIWANGSNRTTLSLNQQKNGFFANAHGMEPQQVDNALHDADSRDILEPNQDVVHWKAINRTSYYKNDFAAELEVGYQSNLRHEWSPYVPHGYMPPNAHTIPNTPQNLERMFDKSTLSGNIGASWHWDNGQELKWGLQTEHQQNTTEGWSFIIPMFKQLTGGTYLFGKRKLSEQWTLNGAIRGDVGKIEVSQYNDWFATPLPSSTGTDSLVFLERAPNATRRFSSVVWSVGAVFDQAPYLLKMNVGKSFRMPIAKELGANGVNYHNFSYERGNINLNAEQSYQVDMSMQINKAGWAVQVSPFFNVFPNYIYLNPTPQYDYLYGAGNQVFDYTQASVMRYGSELHAHVNLTEWLQTGVVGEWVYSLQTSGDKQGFTLPFSPPPSLILNLRADVKPWGITRKSYLSADVKLVGPQNRIVPPEKPTDGYTTLALSAGGQLKVGNQWVSINAQVLNLLNTKYYNHTSYYRLIDLPEAGRNIIVNLTIPFTLINNAL